MIDLDEKQPCYYATLKNSQSKKYAKWEVGVKDYNNSSNIVFKLSDLGNVENTRFWGNKTSLKFALSLINAYREGGIKKIKKKLKI